MQKSPYEKHRELGHKVTHYSPNGIDEIEECCECSYRALLKFGRKYPVTLWGRVSNSNLGGKGK